MIDLNMFRRARRRGMGESVQVASQGHTELDQPVPLDENAMAGFCNSPIHQVWACLHSLFIQRKCYCLHTGYAVIGLDPQILFSFSTWQSRQDQCKTFPVPVRAQENTPIDCLLGLLQTQCSVWRNRESDRISLDPSTFLPTSRWRERKSHY